MDQKQKQEILSIFTRGLNNSECRDKILKLLQYSSLFASWHLQDQEKYEFMYKQLTESRRLLRLFKSIILIPTITALAQQPKKTFSRYSSSSLLFLNICYFLFYLLDNFSILTKYKLINILKYKHTKYSAYYTLSVGLVAAMAYYLVLLRKSYVKESELKNQLQNMTPNEFCGQVAKISDERKSISLNIVKLLAQGITVFNRAKIPESVLNTRFNEGFVAIAGISSAVISLHQMFKRSQINQMYYI